MLDKNAIEVIKSTVPVLEQYGEKITTVFYEQMFEAHPELLNIFNHANQKQGRQQRALASTVYAAAMYIDNLEAIVPVVTQIAHKHRSLGIKPEHYPIVGEHLLGAIKHVLGDAATDEIIGAWAQAYNVIADVFISVETEMYNEATTQSGGWDGFQAFIVDRKVKESEVITSFYLKPANQQVLPKFKPGQYISVKLEMEGEEFTHIRQYSLSDAPGKKYFRISVKKEKGSENPDGLVSNYLHDQITEGDRLEISAPAGDFFLDTEKNTPIVLLSGGVGVTPMTSMLNTIVDLQPEREVTFIHATTNSQTHALRDEILTTASKGKVKTAFFYDSPTKEDRENKLFDFEGFVTKEWIKEHLSIDHTEFYFCGPVPFMKAMNSALKELGVQNNNIHFEFFGPMGNLEE